MHLVHFKILNCWLKKSLAKVSFHLEQIMGGGGFCSHAFSNFCVEHDIKCQLTTPYTPHQNSVFEHCNRMIVEMARFMLQHRRVPNKY